MIPTFPMDKISLSGITLAMGLKTTAAIEEMVRQISQIDIRISPEDLQIKFPLVKVLPAEEWGMTRTFPARSYGKRARARATVEQYRLLNTQPPLPKWPQRSMPQEVKTLKPWQGLSFGLTRQEIALRQSLKL